MIGVDGAAAAAAVVAVVVERLVLGWVGLLRRVVGRVRVAPSTAASRGACTSTSTCISYKIGPHR